MRPGSGRGNIPRQKRRITKALLAGVVLLAVSIPLFIPPEVIPVPGCAFHAITGLCCPTCGMTRSLHALSLGDWRASFRYHLMGPLVFAGMLLFSAVSSFEAVTGKRVALWTQGGGKKRGMVLFAVVWLVYWGVRLITGLVA